MYTRILSTLSRNFLFCLIVVITILSYWVPIYAQSSIDASSNTSSFSVLDATEFSVRIVTSSSSGNGTLLKFVIKNLPTAGISAVSLRVTGPNGFNYLIPNLTIEAIPNIDGTFSHKPQVNPAGKGIELVVGLQKCEISISIDHYSGGTNEVWSIALWNLNPSGETAGTLDTTPGQVGQFTDIYLKPEVNAGPDFTIIEGTAQAINAALIKPHRHFNIATKTWDNGIIYTWSSTDFNPQNSLVTTYTAPVSNITPYAYTLKATAGLLEASDELSITIYQNNTDIDKIIRDALEYLTRQQKGEGFWVSPHDGNANANVGLTAMAAWCFLKYGIDETNSTYRAVKWAIQWIKSQQDTTEYFISNNIGTRVYDTALAILALMATNNKNENKYTDIIQKACRYLISWQNDKDLDAVFTEEHFLYGGWGYGTPSKIHADLSNTQFVLLALHYAEENNFYTIPTSDSLWEKAFTFVTRCQNRKGSNPDYAFGNDGGFGYQPHPEKNAHSYAYSYGSMTTAGLWGLACCRSKVNKTNTIPAQESHGWSWVEHNYTVKINPFFGNKTKYYYLFGMTRAALLCNRDLIGSYSWKKDISDELIKCYNDSLWNVNNKWHPDEKGLIGFCWALLALEDTQNPPSGSKLVIKVASPVDLHVYDQKNNHVGINYHTGVTEIQIPGALYSGAGAHPQVIEIPDLISGTYTINLVGTGEGEFTLTIDGFLNEKNIFSDISTGRITSKEVFKAQATVSRIVGPLTIDTTPANRVVSGLECSSVREKIYLKWNKIEKAEGYKIYYDSDFPGMPYNGGADGDGAVEGKSSIDVGNNTTFQLTGLNTNKKYYIVVTYYADSSECSFSHEVQCIPSGIYEAEAMENRKSWYGSPCPDGWRLTHQNQPVHQEIHILSPIDCYFTIRAKAEIAGHAAPWLGVTLGDIFNGYCEVSSTEWKEYSFLIKNLPAGTHQLALSFLNDYWNKYQGDRNLLLDEIIIEQYSGQTIDTSYVFEAEDMKESYIDNFQSGDYMVLHKPYSYLQHEFYFEQPELTFIIYAKGDSIKGGWPQMDFQLDGQTKASFLVNSDVPQQYSVQLRDITPGKHQIKISYNYTSYTYLRKLYIDKMEIINNKGNLLKPKPAIEADENSNISLPETFRLEQNFPNPFNPDTQIKYQLPIDTHVTIRVFNTLGQEIKLLVDEDKKAGFYTLNWNGLNNFGNPVGSGIYLYMIQADKYYNIKKMVFIK